MKKTRLLALTLVMVMVFAMFAGCKPAEKADPVDPSKPVEENKEPVKGKIRTDLISAEPSDIVTLDPPESTDTYSGKAINMIFDTLIDMDADSNFIPGLATEWKEVSDTEVVFTIRKDVKFHNGELLTPEDVKFSLERVKENPKSKSMLAQVKSIDIVDGHKISLKLTEKYAPLYVNLTESACHIMNKKAVEKSGNMVAQEPVGTGPMSLEYWKPNNEAKLVRFDEHWAGKPVTTSIILRVIPESGSRTISLEAGEVDMVLPIASVDIQKAIDNPKIATLEMPSSSIIYLSVNQNKAPFNNKTVRQALHFATDKESMIEVVFESYALPGISPFPSIMPSFDESLKDMYEYNLDKAKALMTQAGMADGFEMEICVSSDERNRAAQILQADFGKIGVKVKINLMEFGALMDYCNVGTHDALILGWGHATNQDRTMTNNFHSAAIGPTGNRSWYNNPEVDKLIEEGRRETDWPKREAIYKKLQHIIMDDAAWIPLWQQTNVYAFNANLKGVIWYKRTGGFYTNAYIEEPAK